MSGQPAARLGDMHTCPMIDPGPKPHIGGPILPVCAGSVLIGGLPAARVSDKLVCIGPPDTIVKGSFVVPISGKPAARMTDTTAHGGVIVAGCPTVLIGLAGTTGDLFLTANVFTELAKGRKPPSWCTDPRGRPIPKDTQCQSYSNCGIESVRQIINHVTGKNLTQEFLMGEAIVKKCAKLAVVGSIIDGLLVTRENKFHFSGGTKPSSRVEILKSHGISATTVAPTMENLEKAVWERKGVVVAVDASYLWPHSSASRGSWHAILVTGVEYDEDGNRTHIVINDTGFGVKAHRVPITDFEDALKARNGISHVVTDDPIW